MKFLYTDIDFVLSLASEIKVYQTKWGDIQKFNDKAVKVYNRILQETEALPVITSTWRDHHSLKQLQEIFIEWAGIEVAPIDVTPSIPGMILQYQAEHRSKEILQHVNQFNPSNWCAIDDLDLSKWMDGDHFVWLPRSNEGIKQCNKANKVINLLNK